MRIWYNDAFKAGYEKGFAKAKKLLDDIDTITVVRCKDCKYKNSDIYKNAYTCDRFKGNVFVVDDDYCSYAERRSDEAD